MPALAQALAERIDDLVAAMEQRHPPQIRAWLAERPELVPQNRRFTHDSILAEIHCLRDGGDVPDSAPEVDLALARMAAQLEVPLANLLWGYRNGHRVQWEGWFELAAGDEDLLRTGWAFFFAYADRLSELVTIEYTDERERALRGAEQRRMQVVSALLSGEEVDPAALGYELNGWHLGAVLSGADGQSAAHALATFVGRRSLAVQVDERLWWAWLGGPRPLAADALHGWPAPAGTLVSLGLDASGSEGFRTTHRQAGAAHRAGAATFDDVALEALATGEEEPHAFVARELRGLDGDDARSVELRDTLQAWFAAGHNAAAAAAALAVHEQTVANRLRTIEQRTGRAPASRRAELEVALRLRRAGQTS